jgi:hypothetical protein
MLYQIGFKIVDNPRLHGLDNPFKTRSGQVRFIAFIEPGRSIGPCPMGDHNAPVLVDQRESNTVVRYDFPHLLVERLEDLGQHDTLIDPLGYTHQRQKLFFSLTKLVYQIPGPLDEVFVELAAIAIGARRRLDSADSTAGLRSGPTQLAAHGFGASGARARRRAGSFALFSTSVRQFLATPPDRGSA